MYSTEERLFVTFQPKAKLPPFVGNEEKAYIRVMASGGGG